MAVCSSPYSSFAFETISLHCFARFASPLFLQSYDFSDFSDSLISSYCGAAHLLM
jgi:hypothetical protein